MPGLQSGARAISDRGSSTNARSCMRGCGTCKPCSSIEPLVEQQDVEVERARRIAQARSQHASADCSTSCSASSNSRATVRIERCHCVVIVGVRPAAPTGAEHRSTTRHSTACSGRRSMAAIASRRFRSRSREIAPESDIRRASFVDCRCRISCAAGRRRRCDACAAGASCVHRRRSPRLVGLEHVGACSLSRPGRPATSRPVRAASRRSCSATSGVVGAKSARFRAAGQGADRTLLEARLQHPDLLHDALNRFGIRELRPAGR